MKKKQDEILLELKNVSQSFFGQDDKEHVIIDDINLELKSGEIVALVGKSGSGKSTLLRIIANLNKQSSGQIAWHLKNDADDFGMSMIFQSFALFPWLTVLENVEIGLKSMNIPEKERRDRALDAISLIGLNGFESAYPRELSGGMKQRVGFARAMVVRPEILLMDEPFSALDILTANTLKSDFLELWIGKKTPLKSVMIVTHSIEEAIALADRVIIFGSNPGRIMANVSVNLTHPRNSTSKEFQALVDDVYSKMVEAADPNMSSANIKTNENKLATILPNVYPNKLVSLMKAIAKYGTGGECELPDLGTNLHLDLSNLILMTEALEMLRLAKVTDSSIKLTELGLRFILLDISKRKQVFADSLISNVPIISHIIKEVKNDENHSVPYSSIRNLLRTLVSERNANKILEVAILWGRHANLFMFDDKKKLFTLSD